MTAMRVEPPITTSTQSHGVTAVEIIVAKIPCDRSNEILNWFRKYMPDVKSINLFSINAEPGAEKWLQLAKNHGARSLPQVTVIQNGKTKYIGELTDIKKTFTQEQGILLTKEAIEI